MSEPHIGPRLNVLVAWPYVKSDVLRALIEMGDSCRFLLDSGAFTAWKAGKVLALDDYCRFLESLPVKPWRYFALDVIGNADATQRNYQTMLDRGFRPIPVFTRGADPAELDRLYETSEVVGLGGVAKADKGAYAWTRWAMQHVAGRKAHILGFTNLDWIKYLRPYSVDSSSWGRARRYGWLDVYRGHGTMGRVMVHEIRKKKRPSPVIEAALRAVDYDAARLTEDSTWRSEGPLSAHAASTRGWIACSADFERHQNVLLFFAAASGADIATLRAARATLTAIRHPSLRPLDAAA